MTFAIPITILLTATALSILSEIRLWADIDGCRRLARNLLPPPPPIFGVL
ncbi:hypothetical protein R80B4_01014 [Fibrobacteres bacterium R8-0-B4]